MAWADGVGGWYGRMVLADGTGGWFGRTVWAIGVDAGAPVRLVRTESAPSSTRGCVSGAACARACRVVQAEG
eukprot:365349-Chlamydomonas_euryale.AAC.4